MLLRTVIAGVLVVLCTGYKEGPPVGKVGYDTLCSDMFPSGHDDKAKTTTVPYEIVTSQNCYKEGTQMEVRVRALSSSDYFRGFFLMSRNGSDVSQAFGKFNTAGQAGIQELDCFSVSKSSVGQSNNDKTSTKTFNWTAPTGISDTLHFRATIVRRKHDFWVGVISSDIVYSSNCTTKTTLKPDPNSGHSKIVSLILMMVCTILSSAYLTIP